MGKVKIKKSDIWIDMTDQGSREQCSEHHHQPTG